MTEGYVGQSSGSILIPKDVDLWPIFHVFRYSTGHSLFCLTDIGLLTTVVTVRARSINVCTAQTPRRCGAGVALSQRFL